jgi:hypothetical protein
MSGQLDEFPGNFSSESIWLVFLTLVDDENGEAIYEDEHMSIVPSEVAEMQQAQDTRVTTRYAKKLKCSFIGRWGNFVVYFWGLFLSVAVSGMWTLFRWTK